MNIKSITLEKMQNKMIINHLNWLHDYILENKIEGRDNDYLLCSLNKAVEIIKKEDKNG